MLLPVEDVVPGCDPVLVVTEGFSVEVGVSLVLGSPGRPESSVSMSSTNQGFGIAKHPQRRRAGRTRRVTKSAIQ